MKERRNSSLTQLLYPFSLNICLFSFFFSRVDRVSSVTVRTTPSNTNSTNNSHECMGRQLGISVSSSGQQQQQQRSNNNSSSIVVSPSPGSSSVSILLGPTSSSMYLHHRHCHHSTAPRSSSLVIRRKRSSSASNSTDNASITLDDDSFRRQQQQQQQQELMMSSSSPQRNGSSISLVVDSVARAKCRSALKINDSMVYLDGPQIYTCAQCRTHLTSHDEIISKSFHGRHGKTFSIFIFRILRIKMNYYEPAFLPFLILTQLHLLI